MKPLEQVLESVLNISPDTYHMSSYEDGWRLKQVNCKRPTIITYILWEGHENFWWPIMSGMQSQYKSINHPAQDCAKDLGISDGTNGFIVKNEPKNTKDYLSDYSMLLSVVYKLLKLGTIENGAHELSNMYRDLDFDIKVSKSKITVNISRSMGSPVYIKLTFVATK